MHKASHFIIALRHQTSTKNLLLLRCAATEALCGFACKTAAGVALGLEGNANSAADEDAAAAAAADDEAAATCGDGPRTSLVFSSDSGSLMSPQEVLARGGG